MSAELEGATPFAWTLRLTAAALALGGVLMLAGCGSSTRNDYPNFNLTNGSGGGAPTTMTENSGWHWDR
jgi:hypothetical protein